MALATFRKRTGSFALTRLIAELRVVLVPLALVAAAGCNDSSPTSPAAAKKPADAVPSAGEMSLRAPVAGSMSANLPPAGALSTGMSLVAPLVKGNLPAASASPFGKGNVSAAALPPMRLLWQNTYSGDRSIWLMNGYTWDGSYASLPQVSTNWSIAGTGDFNGDGNADILWQNTYTGDRAIWFMNGNTWTGNYALLPNVSTDWSIAGVADFNGDGSPDIVWQNTITGDRAIWYMASWTWNGSYALLPRVSTQWSIAAVGDFNGDGKPDLVWQNTTTGDRSIWFMGGASGATWLSYAILPTVSTQWRIAAVGDFDGDAKLDIVWQNISTGERSIWFMNNWTWTGYYAYLGAFPTTWSIAGVLATAAPNVVTLSVTNQLIDPINVFVNGTAVGSVPGSSTRTTSFNITGSMTVSYDLVRPTTTANVAIGEQMSGVFPTVANAIGTYNVTVNNYLGSQAYFSPLITNSGANPILMAVNWGLVSENRCYCTVPAGGSAINIGYYRLFSNTEVRGYGITSGYGYGTYVFWTYSGFGGTVYANSGVVYLNNTLTLYSPASGLGAPGVAGTVTAGTATIGNALAPQNGYPSLGKALPKVK